MLGLDSKINYGTVPSMSGILIRILTVQLILPAADEIGAISSDLDEITIDPVRLKFRTPTSR